MAKRIVVLASLVIFVVGLSGCATARKQKELEIQGLKNQITVLESQLQSKDEEMGSLRETISRQQEKAAQDVIKKSGSKKKVIAEAKSRPKTKQIQVALKNGGFYIKKSWLNKDKFKFKFLFNLKELFQFITEYQYICICKI